MIALNHSDFDTLLKENLLLYTSPEEPSANNLFNTHREVSIARYALTHHAQVYHRSVEILKEVLDRIEEQAAINPQNTPQQILVAINAIESKSAGLIAASKEVIQLLSSANNIDVDKGALKTILLNLPLLVKETISKISGDEKLAEEIALGLNNKINEMMAVVKFNEGTMQQGNQQVQAITFNQFNQMINSVPTQPTQDNIPPMNVVN